MLPAILIVDDEPDLLELFRAMLRNLHYRIVTAKDTSAALNFLETELPALIILDIAMPFPNGLDLLRTIRANPRYEAVKIMILTAAPGRLTKEDAVLVSALVSKPITPSALEQAVVNIIGR
jgi:CheY-like chemotaxis protein